MLNFKSNITYYLSSTPTDMRKSREGLAGVVREKMQRDPYTYGDAFIFYSKDLKKVNMPQTNLLLLMTCGFVLKYNNLSQHCCGLR